MRNVWRVSLLLVFVVLVAAVATATAARTDPANAIPAPGREAAARAQTLRRVQEESWQAAVRTFPNGIPAGARTAAWEKMQRASAYWAGRRSPLVGDQWFPIGPAPIEGGQTYSSSCRVPVTGRASTIATNPQNPDQVWLGTANGGVWFSGDGGHYWIPLSDDQPSLAIGAIALEGCSASGCQTVFAGTGENNMRRDTYYGAGLLIGEATGQGASLAWTVSGQSLFNRASINNVVLDPSTAGASKRLYVGVSSGVTASATESTVTAPEPPQGYGIYRSDNRGVSWAKLTVPGAAGARPTDLEMSPQDSNRLFAGFLGRGIFRGTRNPSTNAVSWCPLNPGIALPAGCAAATGLPDPGTTSFDHVEISIAPSAPDTLYAIFGNCSNPIVTGCYPSIYRTTDGGNSWTQMTNSAPQSYSRYTHVLSVHPTNPNILYFGGLRLHKSTNGGQNFSEIGTCTVHPDHQALVFPDPANPNRLYNASDGGFAYSNDGGLSWQSGTGGLQITGFQSISASPLTDRVIGGTQDNGTNMWLGSMTWDHRVDGDSASTIMDRQSALAMYDLYIEESPRRSLNGGTCCWWQDISNGLVASDPSAFYPPMVQDPTPSPGGPDPSIYPNYYKLYFGTNRLYQSAPGPGQTTPAWHPGDSWQPVSCALGDTGEFFQDIQQENVITAIAVAPGNQKRIYIGYYDGQIFVTSGACVDADCSNPQCWQPGQGLPGAVVTRIAVSPTNPDVAYATFSGFNLPGCAHVYKTTNGGSNWTAASGPAPCDPDNLSSLPDIPANTINVMPGQSQNLWLGTDIGVYRSFDGGATWMPGNGTGNDALPNVPVYEIAIEPSRDLVIAGTHGRGAFLYNNSLQIPVDIYKVLCKAPCLDLFLFANAVINPADLCTIDLIQEDGTILAGGSVDAQGGLLGVNEQGQLVTSQRGLYTNRPGAWACLGGSCAGGIDTGEIAAENPITAVGLTCGDQHTVQEVATGGDMQGPASTTLALSGLAALGQRAAAQESFALAVSMARADGSTRELCRVDVPLQADDSSTSVAERAAAVVNESGACARYGINAAVLGVLPVAEEADEDRPVDNARLVLDAPGLYGVQLVTAVETAPGTSQGLTFDVNGVGVPLYGTLLPMEVGFSTGAGGAAGGAVTVVERSPLGTCALRIPIREGAQPAEIARLVRAAFHDPALPASCPAQENPRDVTADESGVQMTLASEVVVQIDDAGIGFSLRPEARTVVADRFIFLPMAVTAGR